MSLDLLQFQDAFLEESFEALDAMEAALLKLSAGDGAADVINTVFRAAHSIKGGGATLGFTALAHFTHTLETLLDQLRSGKRSVQPALVDVLLRSSDIMRAMLTAIRTKEDVDPVRVADVHRELEAILAVAPAAAAPAVAAKPAAPVAAQVAVDAAPATGGRGWLIELVPGVDMLRHGSDPLRMLRELATLGSVTARANASAIPTLADLDPEVCLLRWKIELETTAARDAVAQVFSWADDECELRIDVLPGDAPAAVGSPVAVAVAEAEVAPPTGTLPVAASAAASAAPAPADKGPADKGASEKGDTARGAGDGGSIRVGIEKIDDLLNAVGELVITQSVLSQLAERLDGGPAEEMRGALVQLERHMRSLQESVMRVRMLPISFAFNRFPRLIRDLGQKLGKSLELKMTGEQTELDKTVLEKLGDPLVHLVRNSIDHGIELPEVRRAAGKSETGTIQLHAYHKGGSIIVEVTDDGGGLNRQKILAKARERGLVGPDEELSEEKVFNLIFAPGFSTADVVSDVSGRGVGMDVVKRNINEIGGHVQIFSKQGQGSTVRIRLPLTLAILDGQLMRVGTEVYVVPIGSIVETIEIRREQISSIANRVQLLRLRDEYIPIVRMYQQFGIDGDRTDLSNGLLMIVEADGERLGLFVDELLSQQQVVIKSLESNFRHVVGFMGATILGDGRVALILDIPGILVSYKKMHPDVRPTREAA